MMNSHFPLFIVGIKSTNANLISTPSPTTFSKILCNRLVSSSTQVLPFITLTTNKSSLSWISWNCLKSKSLKTKVSEGPDNTAPLLWEWESTMVRKILRKLKILPIPRSHHPSYRDESWPNFRELIRYNKKLRKLISETIHDEECISSKLFNVKYIDSIFKKHLSGEKNFTYLLLLLLTFVRWHKNTVNAWQLVKTDSCSFCLSIFQYIVFSPSINKMWMLRC